MRIEIKNNYGSFEMGGGSHPIARIENISGLGLPQKEAETITFAGQPGQTTKNIRDLSRTITISCDFYGGQHEIEKLYRILYHPVELWIIFGTRRRKISGNCINPEDVEKIIFQRHYKVVLQFICDDPYFEDFYNHEIVVFQIEDQFPNLYEDGEWYIQLPAIATVRTSRARILNNGDIDVYPIIRIYNNTSDIALLNESYGLEITNETNGAKITLNYDTVDGEEITIDLPRRKITSNINGNIIGSISDDTVLSNFILQPGENVINCVNFSTSASISAIVEYSNKYAMAVIR